MTPGQSDVSAVIGGPLGFDTHVLAQYHFHWGSVSTAGSEHLIDYKQYAGEVRHVPEVDIPSKL